ncbi:acyl-CoA thioesterase [Acinetobacter sp. ANC 4648]|uniref:acyl-CoA thioesterase n=1 Tax=Acinetobacter sp. ANC 4648 TaxID=1977875 RepID=UPI000A3429B5|nr:acyl-CoA thioesterase [Acinetobacter sp. ANC 4648]OTG84741.1 4-hydroxybenzoyl-CoA thioesterase [Acinetobacter sp. ANC 4648]
MHADVVIEIPFHDVDSMNIVWHGHYLKYFEIARCQLLDEFKYNYVQMKDSGYAWPIIESHVRYVQGIEFQQKIRVRARLKEWENRLKIEYLIFDAKSGQRLTKGYTTQVAVHMQSREMCFQSPPVLFERLNAWPAFQLNHIEP